MIHGSCCAPSWLRLLEPHITAEQRTQRTVVNVEEKKLQQQLTLNRQGLSLPLPREPIITVKMFILKGEQDVPNMSVIY